MKISKSYKLSEFLDWTRRRLYVVLVLAIVPVVLYQLLDQKWIALPWSVAVLLGTAASFIVGSRSYQFNPVRYRRRVAFCESSPRNQRRTNRLSKFREKPPSLCYIARHIPAFRGTPGHS